MRIIRTTFPRRAAGPWLLLLAACTSLAASGCRTELELDLHAFTSQRPLVRTLAAYDSKAVTLDCKIGDGRATVYQITNYQWSRIDWLADRGQAAERTLRERFAITTYEQADLELEMLDGGRMTAAVMVTPDGCCEYSLSNAEFTVRGPGGTGHVTFWCEWPTVQNILVELPPAQAGGRYIWIIMNIQEPDPDAPKTDPRNG